MKKMNKGKNNIQNVQLFQKKIMFKTMVQEQTGTSIKENGRPRNIFMTNQKFSYMLKWLFKTGRDALFNKCCFVQICQRLNKIQYFLLAS